MTDEEYDRALLARNPFMVSPSRMGVSGVPVPRQGDTQYAYTPLEAYKNLARGVGTGATLNWLDEGEALARSKMEGGRSYEEELRDIRNQYGAWAQRNPYTSFGSEFVGGIVPMAALYATVPATGGATLPAAVAATARTAGTLKRLRDAFRAKEIGAGAAVGATEGAISGAGGANESDNVGSQALTFGALGGVLGGVLSPVTRLAGPPAADAWNWLKSKADIPAPTRDVAVERMAQAAADARLSPTQIGQEVAEGRSANIATVDPRFGALAEEAVGSSTAAQREAEALLRPRIDDANAIERLSAETRTQLRAGNYATELAALKDSRSQAADLSYRRAYNTGDIADTKLQEQLDNPIVLEAWDRARQIARSNADAAQSNASKLGEAFNPADFSVRNPGEIPDIRTIDYLKRTLDADITAILKKTEPTAAESTRLHDLITVRNNLRDRAKEINPDYRNALDRFASSVNIEEAFLLGRKEFRNLDNTEIAKMFGKGGLSEPEKYAFRTGVSQNIYDAMASTPIGGNVANRVIQTVGDIDRFKPLFDGDKFNLFAAAVRRESEMIDQARRVIAAGEAGGARRAVSEPSVVEDVSRALTQIVIGNPQTSLVNQTMRIAQSPDVNDEMASRLTRMLLSSEPKEVAAAVKAIEDYSARMAERERRQTMNRNFARRGIIAAAPFAPFPEGENAQPNR